MAGYRCDANYIDDATHVLCGLWTVSPEPFGACADLDLVMTAIIAPKRKSEWSRLSKKDLRGGLRFDESFRLRPKTFVEDGVFELAACCCSQDKI